MARLAVMPDARVDTPVTRSTDTTVASDQRQTDAALARLAEGVWRIERRAKREESADWVKPLLERVYEDLRDLGVEIIDLTGRPFGDGYSFEVLHNEAPDGWKGDLVVTEVISPAIRLGGGLVEHGKVVVGREQDKRVEESTCQAK